MLFSSLPLSQASIPPPPPNHSTLPSGNATEQPAISPLSAASPQIAACSLASAWLSPEEALPHCPQVPVCILSCPQNPRVRRPGGVIAPRCHILLCGSGHSTTHPLSVLVVVTYVLMVALIIYGGHWYLLPLSFSPPCSAVTLMMSANTDTH